ncbi:uncharacterized protein NP_2904A [Natronomonas pharaonis DSM 2160]|uniref:KaiC-like domain-containing protein n=1 Tax=Natronomonas pharaonis (strain ATCC 35678 / DSM 2160 / CIP 103997 / JCM 8858 / NBRC 14720 / NCIMB 2260 / Gabara) TaxID=348780 RepID=A0A1U7EWT0_NATPD|nr:hypothetical protein [Natronomonas pharaonis]CAI49543.1 uncharacterized protein NP_2904A [Natronomonas pharaonis DSM 2160]
MSYSTTDLGNASAFDEGVSLLMTGASTVTNQRLLDAVAPEDGERAIVITMNMGAQQVVKELERRGADRDQLGIIDCTSTEADVEGVPVRQLSSPGDLTGISLEFAKLLDQDSEDESVRARIGFASVSTALMYAELRTMFRFLHVFTARIRSGDMLGVFAMDPSMHEDQAHNTIRAVFDCEAEVTDDDITVRGTGFEE